MNVNLAKKIKEKIQENRLNVQSLEKEAGLKVHAVRNILTGRSKNPGAETLLAISKVLHCSVSELLGEISTSKEENIYHKNEEFENLDLLLEAASYTIKECSKYKENIKIKDLFDLIYDVYKYSYNNNNQNFDEKFANWMIERYFD